MNQDLIRRYKRLLRLNIPKPEWVTAFGFVAEYNLSAVQMVDEWVYCFRERLRFNPKNPKMPRLQKFKYFNKNMITFDDYNEIIEHDEFGIGEIE